MRCYNAAMSKPFQFSMRRLFIATTLFAIAAALLHAFASFSDSIYSYGKICEWYFALFGGLTAFIAGCGVIIEAEPRRIIRPIAWLLLLGLVLFTLSTFGHFNP
jgi:hypothetical protein